MAAEKGCGACMKVLNGIKGMGSGVYFLGFFNDLFKERGVHLIVNK